LDNNTDELLRSTAERAIAYLDGLDRRPVFPARTGVDRLVELGGELPDDPMPAAEVIELLDEIGSPATVATAGPRYFGFVIGGTLPAALAANWLATTWDQCAALEVLSPAAARIEEIALDWLVDLFNLPAGTAGAFVTGASQANLVGLAAARHALLARAGWDLAERGMSGAPPLRVVAGEEIHSTMLKMLGVLGFGHAQLERVPVDSQGRMIAARLPPLDPMTLVCVQAGNVNSGCFDPAEEICAAAREQGAWVHVDGAFGLWANASPALAHHTRGFKLADSWSTDCHKWLNTPYDCGLALVRDAEALRAAMRIGAAYLPAGPTREPSHYSLELSRRARGVEVWAALKSLGRSGLAEMIDRNCQLARQMASRLSDGGLEILNDVVINQVVVSLRDERLVAPLVKAVQDSGECWCGGTVWQGRQAFRVSVSNWSTTPEDIDRSATAIIALARNLGA
jgi:glutamate/tyrosine decarboxylase-like PLP-dependent enzyme